MDPGEDSFRAFVRARSTALGRSAYLLTGDRHLAEDLLQTALYQAARRWSHITAAGDPEAYVRRILYTTHVSWWRRRRLTEAYGVELPDVAETQTAAVLGCAVGTVKSQTRHALGRLRVLAPELVDLVTVEVDS